MNSYTCEKDSEQWQEGRVIKQKDSLHRRVRTGAEWMELPSESHGLEFQERARKGAFRSPGAGETSKQKKHALGPMGGHTLGSVAPLVVSPFGCGGADACIHPITSSAVPTPGRQMSAG